MNSYRFELIDRHVLTNIIWHDIITHVLEGLSSESIMIIISENIHVFIYVIMVHNVKCINFIAVIFIVDETHVRFIM